MYNTLKTAFCFLLCLFVAAGERTQAASLVDYLQSITCEAELDPGQAPVWAVHQGWVRTMIDFVQTQQSRETIQYPDDTSHPIHYFDRHDAQTVLKPLFWNLARLDLNDALIERLFLEKIPVYKETHKRTPPEPFYDEAIKKEVYETAKKAHDLAQGHVLLILGQTPAYVGEMIKTIDAALSGHMVLVRIPFSGRPDYKRKLNYKGLWSSAFMDLVTADGRERFLDRLRGQQFSPDWFKQNPKKIYILDNSSGASVACFLALMKGWFDEEGVPFPETVFLEMCAAETFTILRENGKWTPAQKPDLRFDDGLGFDIPVEFLGMQDDILKLFDKVHDNLRIVPSFNAIHWSKSYLDEALQRYPTPEALRLAEAYRDYAAQQVELTAKET